MPETPHSCSAPPAEAACPCAPDPVRRTTLGALLAGAGALVVGSLGVAAGFLSNALGRERQRPWVRLGDVNDPKILNVDTFQRHVVEVEQRHAWQVRRLPLDIYIKDLYPDDPLVLRSTCSHLGCAVGWKAEAQQFRCPCHGGTYDAEGRVVSGPPPAPLTRLEVKIEDEVCFVRLPGDGETA